MSERMKHNAFLILALAVAVVFAGLWGRSEYRRGQADRDAYHYGRQARICELRENALYEILLDRGARDAWQRHAVEAYLGLVDAVRKHDKPVAGDEDGIPAGGATSAAKALHSPIDASGGKNRLRVREE